MPELRTYRVFISHAWAYNDEYYRLVNMLDSEPLFHWQNYSVPVHDPEHGGLMQALYDQIKPVSIVIILGGMYVAYSDWIQREIKMAREMGKPIIGIYPWGSQRIPQAVQDVADEIVGWNTQSIVDAIRRLAI